MAKIYQLMIGKKQVNDVYYDKQDAIDNAKQVHSDMNVTVEIWEAEEIEDTSYDALEWTKIGVALWSGVVSNTLRGNPLKYMFR